MTVQTASTRTELQPVSQKAERCTGCGNPLALDQRYCLNCGKRRGGARIEFEKYLDREPPNSPPKLPPATAVPPADNRPEREVTPLMAAVGLTGLAVILILGVLIGRTGQGSSTPAAAPVVAATGQPVAAGPTTTTTSSTTVSFEADWPAGKEGFTIELATLPKDTSDGTAVETAKTDIVAKGATDVGALDSDEYASLPPGNYVLYSGVYESKAEAEKALEPLKASFPDAQVVEVSTGSGGDTGDAGGGFTEQAAKGNGEDVVEASEDDLKALENATGDEYQEFQKKLPPTIETPGKAPPKDDKAPGGGSGGEVVEIG
ncbi:MAG TPA: hypothetical protein VMF31_09655 [Solirubrobacterales bacterium]|nr:hypothetical protein [Solirubrobacterales bacterium]